MRNFKLCGFVVLALSFLLPLSAAAQQPSASPIPSPSPKSSAPSPSATNEPDKKHPLLTAQARLSAARNVLVIRTRGGDIPYDVIRATVEGWGRYTLVTEPDKADLIMEVSSSGGGGDVRVTSNSSNSPQSGRPEQSTSTSKDISSTEVTLTVLDAQNKRALWHATETAKYAVKQKARENNLVEAAERLASKFHDRIEPPSAR